MKYQSINVAAYIARLCKEFGYSYNNTKIQKLLYCCYGCVLAKWGERLCDEYPRAWQYGPVFPRVFKFIHKNKDLLNHEAITPNDDLDLFLKDVVGTFGKYNAVPLSEWTHRKGSPWDIVVNGMEEGLHGFIPDDLIKEYFQKNVLVAEGPGHESNQTT